MCVCVCVCVCVLVKESGVAQDIKMNYTKTHFVIQKFILLAFYTKGISLKVNVIARQKFEIADFETAVRSFIHYITGSHPKTIICVLQKTN